MSKWTVCVNTPIHPTVLVLNDDGSGELITGSQTLPLQQGSNDGTNFSFMIEREDAGYVKMLWNGAIDGDGMSGTIECGDLGNYPFVGTRFEQ